MPIPVTCEHCGKRMNAPDALAGKRARCPGCKEVISIPSPDDPVDDSRGYEVAGDDDTSSASEMTAGGGPQRTWQPMRGVDPGGGASSSRPTMSRPAESNNYASSGMGSSFAGAGRAASRLPAAPSGRDRLYWVLLLALVPLGVFTFARESDTGNRYKQTLEHNPSVAEQVEKEKFESLTGLLMAFPDHRIEGAHLARDSWMHWGYAGIAAAVFFGLVVMCFRAGSAHPGGLVAVAVFTGTIGIVLLLGVQLAGNFMYGVWPRGRGVITIVIYIVKFIGFSYRCAEDLDNGFLISFFGFTAGVGFCEELAKALPIVLEFRRRSPLGWRGAALWGLASGVGFGISEGIHYSSHTYNGLATGAIYLVRFASCVALHALWSAAVGIMIWKKQYLMLGEMDWGDWLIALVRILAVPMVLHGLYDTLLKREMPAIALVVAFVSFGWMAWVIEKTRHDEFADAAVAVA